MSAPIQENSLTSDTFVINILPQPSVPIVSFQDTSYTVAETGNFVTVTVELNGAPATAPVNKAIPRNKSRIVLNPAT